MKLLINLCGHDGIISHYAGVGTIVSRYIEAIDYLLNKKNIEYHLNLFTLEFNKDSLGYNEKVWNKHKKLKNSTIYICSNGTNGETSFGNIYNWQCASSNVAKIINDINFNDYDYIITLANDTPFAGVLELINESENSIKVWIPHSTGKIYNEDMSLLKKNQTQKERIKWEQAAIDYINSHNNSYLISTGKYIRNHLINEYSLHKNKYIDVINGELLYRDNIYEKKGRMKKILLELEKYNSIIMSLGRAERYKNLDKTMFLGKKLGIKPVVITQQYFKRQPIVFEYKKIAEETNAILYVDEPFSLPQYIVENYSRKMIMLIPSEREIFGLVINEMRRFNKDNVLIVANSRGGLIEQIDDGIDGVLVDLDDIEHSAKKISKYFDPKIMKKINQEGQKRLIKDYDLIKNFDNFFKKVFGEEYE